MKKLVLIMLVAFASFNAMANTYPTLSVEGKRSFIVELNDWKNEALVITIEDKVGEIIHAEKIAKAASLRKYSLEQLPIGFYKMTIADQLKDISFDIFVTRDGVNVKNTGKVYFRPFVTNDDVHLDINLLTINKDVNMHLLDSDGTIVYRVKVKNARKFEKRLDISKLPAGVYTLNMYVEDRMYSETIVK